MSAWTYCLQDGKAAPKIVPPRSRIPYWKGLGADSGEKREPASDIDTVVMDSLKALDPNRPIREATEVVWRCNVSRRAKNRLMRCSKQAYSITWSARSNMEVGIVRMSTARLRGHHKM